MPAVNNFSATTWANYYCSSFGLNSIVVKVVIAKVIAFIAFAFDMVIVTGFITAFV